MASEREVFRQIVLETYSSDELRQMARFVDEDFARSLAGVEASENKLAASFVDGALKRGLVDQLLARMEKEREHNEAVASFRRVWELRKGHPRASTSPLPSNSALVDFRAERGRHKHFVGRASILDTLDKWLDTPRRQSGYVLLTGSPGVGKSAIISRWIERRGQGLDKAKHEVVIPHHFIRDHSDWEKPDVIVENIIAQLECKYDVRSDPELAPYRRLGELLLDLSANHLEGGRLFLVLDGLDEARAPGHGNPLRCFIPASLPEGVFVLCASRPEYPNLQWLEQRDGCRRLDLNLEQDSNQETVRDFWRVRGDELTPPLSPVFLEAVIERAGGNMLFSVRYWNQLDNTPTEERRIHAIPRGIEAFLAEVWRRVVSSPEPQRGYIRDGLGILAVAREALSLRQLGSIAGWPADEGREAFLRVARPFLLSEPGHWRGHGTDAYRPYHERFREFLLEQLDEMLATYHGRIIEHIAAWPPKPENDFEKSYAIQHGVSHRLGVDALAAYRMASDPAYWSPCLEKRGVRALELELARVAASVPSGSDEQRLVQLLDGCVRQESHWLRVAPQFAATTLYNRLTDTTGSRSTTDEFWKGQLLPSIRLTRALQHPDDAVRVLQGHSESVNACAVTPDGRHIVSAADENTLRVWPLDGSEPRVLNGHSGPVHACAVTPDGRHIVSASLDCTLRVWPMDGGEPRVLGGHSGSVNACAVTPDGRHIVSASSDNTLRVWPLDGGEPRVLEGHSGSVVACTVTPDGRHIVSASSDNTLRVWPLDGGEPRVLEGHLWVANACVLTPDGRHIVSASSDHTLWVWPLDGGEPRILEDHSGRVFACAVTPDGRHIVSASDDETLRVWPLGGGKPRVLEGHSGPVLACAVTPDGRHIVSASFDQTLRVWPVDGGEPRVFEGHLAGAICAVAVTPDGRHIVSSSFDHTLRVWPVDGGKSRVLEGHLGSVYACALTPDGRHIVSTSFDHTLRLWDFETGILEWVEPMGGNLQSRTFSATRWSSLSKGHLDWVRACVLTPDGRHIVSASDDETLRVWALVGGEPRVLEGHSGSVYACAVTPDGRHIVSASKDKSLRVWPFDGGEPRVLEGHLGSVYTCAVTPDGRHIVSASDDKTLRVWPVNGGEPRVLEGHTQSVNACAVTPDGRHIVSASDDKTLRVWNFDTGECIYTVFGREAFTCVDVSSPALAAGDARGNVWVFEVDQSIVGPPVAPAFEVASRGETVDVDVPALYRALVRHYSGANGSKVFLLALLTLAPLGLKSELLGLRLSLATLVYAAYHGFGIYVWVGVYQLRHVKSVFDENERDAGIRKLGVLHHVVRPLGWVVLALLVLTALAKAELVFGDSSVSAAGLVPQWVRDFLGV